MTLSPFLSPASIALAAVAGLLILPPRAGPAVAAPVFERLALQPDTAQVDQRPRVPSNPNAPTGNPSQPDLNTPPLTPKQQRDLLKSNYEKMKQQADELADLAKSLQDELDKSNQNILSLQVVDKADKIEKLAKKIKDAARGH
ncbi:MAG TPA: hypothetical protein VI455_11115 [Terriglobia bacterium]